MFGVHWVYIVLLLVVVLIIFGPGRLPELGGAVGKAMREFRKATSELTNEVTNASQAAKSEPAPTTTTTATAPESTAKGSTPEATSPKN
jgi:sec-independent protein translocase protein TatA